MACRCEFPITAEEILRGWSGEMSIETYCASCGEAFGPEKKDLKRRRKSRPKKIRQQAPVPLLHQLSVGDQVEVVRAYRPSMPLRGYRRLWPGVFRRIPGTGEWERLQPGRRYRVVKTARGRWSRARDCSDRCVVVEEVGVPNKRQFYLHALDVEIVRVPKLWE
jgi:hypothetical protein